MQKATLVLEGGATRGVFTSGVLDYLMEKDLYFSNVIGVSAGSCNAVDYVSKQPGRTRDCMIPTDKSLNYVNGLRTFIKEKSLMNMDMIFDIYPKQIYPFDFDTYFRSEMNGELVTTNCVTGKAEYMDEAQDPDRLMKICRASSSMPLLCPIVNIDGIPYLDGGLADSIPIRRAMDIGNEKIIVVLTRNRGYRKKAVSKAVEKMYRRAYRSYPNLLRTLLRRAPYYNRTLNELENLEREGKIFVIRPQGKTVSRLESKPEVLEDFYQHGIEQMKEHFGAMQDFLEK